MTLGKHGLFSLFLFYTVTVSVAQKSPASESDLKRQAEKLFEKENYAEATPMYSQLLSLYPREAVYNYRYGVCLLMSGEDKTGAASYLEAASKAKETDADVQFYLGRSYMFMDHYNEAIAAFTLFKKSGSPARQIKLQPDIYIRNCENANQLRMDRKNVVVLSKTKVNRQTFFAAYDFTNAAGKLLTTPDRFLTPLDREKMNNPVMFMAKDGETIYYASYGKKGEHGKDIYRIIKLPDGSWSNPLNLGSAINTDESEDYPYLDKDGRTLYFCSRGHNSMGGYDVFKSQYDFNTGQWSDPVNVGIPINTVDDDIFYMPSTKGETAVYSTAVECASGKIELRNIKLGDVVSNIAVINGTYISEDQVTRRDARITVIRTRDNGVVTSVKTDRMGEYELVLPAGEDYMLIVEGGSYLPHAENFSIPAGKSIPGMKQKVVMNKSSDKEEMTMSNYFAPSPASAGIAASEKPTQVTKTEFDLKDTAANKMQAITFEGKTLYVAPPSAHHMQPSTAETAEVKEASNAEPPVKEPAVVNHDQPTTENITGETKNVEGAGKKSPAGKHTETGISEKTSNAELVKMAFDDAQSEKEEARAIRQEALERRGEANSLDSLSKAQLKDANELLASGDKEQSQKVFNDSRETALDAIQKNREADSLVAESNTKDADAESSFRQATTLMREFKVDTNAVTYQAIGKKNTAAPSADITSDEGNDSLTSVPEQEEKIYAEGSHTAAASKLNDEADALLLQSLEMDQRAENATDKSQKNYYSNKSKDLKKQSETKKNESKKESALAVKADEQPVAINSGGNSSQAKQEEERKTTPESVTEQVIPAAANKNDEHKSEEPAATESQKESKAVPSEEVLKEENTEPSFTPVDVDPVARTHFENYRKSMVESKKLENSSKETEAKLLTNNTKEKRDSLEAKTSELNQQSIREWQAAQKELALAKESDADIESKMSGNASASGSKPKSSAATTQHLPEKTAEPAKENSQEKKQVIADVTRQENVADQSQEAPQVSPANGTSKPVAAEEILDTTKPEYPKYVETQKAIAEKQAETVKSFVEGMQLSKVAAAIKADEMKFRDQAQVTSDKKAKAKLEEKADSLAMEAEIITGHSKEKLSLAQKNTGTVKELTAKSNQLKEALVVKENPQPEQLNIAANTTKSEETARQNQPSGQPAPAQDISEKMNQDTAVRSAAAPDTIVLQKPAAEEAKPAEEKNNQAENIAQTNPVDSAIALQPAEKKTIQPESQPADTGARAVVIEPENAPMSTSDITDKVSEHDVTEPSQTKIEKEIQKDVKQPVQQNASGKNTPSSPSPSSSAAAAEPSPSAQASPERNNVEQPASTGSSLIFENEVSDASTFSLARGDAYSSSNPIPMDPVLPEGLVFKVQIGAFRKALPDNAFKNLQPLSGETTRPGWIRYCLGLFRTFEPANLLKKEVRTMGYPDAFVVAYYNGKRIPLYDAYTILNKANAAAKQTYAVVSDKEFSQLSKFEIRKSNFDSKPDEDTQAFYGTAGKISPDLVEYAVQVGVYKTSKTPSALSGLLPLNTEQTATGLFRFTTGRYGNRASADSMKRVAVGAGIKDAFVVIYRGGKKAGVAETQKILSALKTTPKAPEANPSIRINQPPVQPATAAVAAGDVIFKIQLGAFKENVPFNTVSSFLQIADKGISQETDARGLHIFYAGSFTSYDEALAAKGEIASKGVKDAFIVGFVKGRRTSATEALQLLNRK